LGPFPRDPVPAQRRRPGGTHHVHHRMQLGLRSLVSESFAHQGGTKRYVRNVY
jgi:hypothetical protein